MKWFPRPENRNQSHSSHHGKNHSEMKLQRQKKFYAAEKENEKVQHQERIPVLRWVHAMSTKAQFQGSERSEMLWTLPIHWEARPMDTDQRAKIAGHAHAIAALGRNRPRTGKNPCWDRRSRARASAPTPQSRNCKFLIRTSSGTQAGWEGRIHSERCWKVKTDWETGTGVAD